LKLRPGGFRARFRRGIGMLVVAYQSVSRELRNTTHEPFVDRIDLGAESHAQ
jgi:hypothetical protein